MSELANSRDHFRPRAFLGVGLAFPLRVTPGGKLATARAEAKIEESLYVILSTAIGERVMRPSFGCGIHDLVFAPSNESTMARVIDDVRRALVTHEPRIDLLDVEAETMRERPNLLLIRLSYRIRENNAITNFVYPFFITEGA